MLEKDRIIFDERRRSLDGCIARIILSKDPDEVEQMYAYGAAYLHMMLAIRRKDFIL